MAQIQDSPHGYGWLSIALHWVSAILIVALIAVALYADSVPRDAGRPLRFLHVSLGLLFIPFYLSRLFWRLRAGHPHTEYGGPIATFLGNLTWRVLLFAPAIMLATGPFLAWLHGRPISFFNIFDIASPFAKNHALRMTIGEVHEIVGFVILGFIVLHILGALKHALIDRDHILKRMFRPA